MDEVSLVFVFSSFFFFWLPFDFCVVCGGLEMNRYAVGVDSRWVSVVE